MSRTQITTDENIRKEDKTIKVVAGISVVLGLWLVATTLLLGDPSTHLVSVVLSGVFVTGIGAFNYYRKHKRKSEGRSGTASRFGSVVIALLGLWVVASAFLFGPEGLLFWNDLVFGTLVALTGVYNGGVSTIDTSDRLIQQSNERPPRTSREG